jgi:TRAP-type mannitol/chloroaromatic compound transport system permease large subunit
MTLSLVAFSVAGIGLLFFLIAIARAVWKEANRPPKYPRE